VHGHEELRGQALCAPDVGVVTYDVEEISYRLDPKEEDNNGAIYYLNAAPYETQQGEDPQLLRSEYPLI
jgi:hypothetical protein